MDLWSLYCPKGILQILICSHIYNQGNVLGISCGRVFVSVQYRSCCNLDMLIDICHIFQIYLNYNCFYFWSEVYLWYFLLWRRFLRLEFLNSFVMNFVSLPTYVNLAIFVLSFFFLLPFLFSIGMHLFKSDLSHLLFYVGYSESKYRLRISPALPRVCNFAHVQWLPLSTDKQQTPFR